MRQLLAESQARVEVWKNKLLQALGVNGQVIIDVIPEVELIIGQQAPVPQLGVAESQNRFNRVFKQFIHAFTAAISMVDYVTQPFPIDAPQNPRYHD